MISNLHYFTPTPSPEQEVFVPEWFDPQVYDRHYFINTYPPLAVRIQQPEIKLEISEQNLRLNSRPSFLGPLIFPVIPVFLLTPIEKYYDVHNKKNHIEMEVTVSKADVIKWDIGKCVMILPNGENIIPEEYRVQTETQFSSQFYPTEILEAHDINTKWHRIMIKIRYPVTTKEVESFHLVWDGLMADSKNVVLPEMKFQKSSIWIGEIEFS